MEAHRHRSHSKLEVSLGAAVPLKLLNHRLAAFSEAAVPHRHLSRRLVAFSGAAVPHRRLNHKPEVSSVAHRRTRIKQNRNLQEAVFLGAVRPTLLVAVASSAHHRTKPNRQADHYSATLLLSNNQVVFSALNHSNKVPAFSVAAALSSLRVARFLEA